MSNIILLDSEPLSIVTNPKQSPRNDACSQWLRAQLALGKQTPVAEIIDYEIRRELLRANKQRGLANLEAAKMRMGFLPITTAVMLKAAELWATARQTGHPTAHDHSLEIDVILAAQAVMLIAAGHNVIVATSNVAHLSHFVPAARWQDIT